MHNKNVIKKYMKGGAVSLSTTTDREQINNMLRDRLTKLKLVTEYSRDGTIFQITNNFTPYFYKDRSSDLIHCSSQTDVDTCMRQKNIIVKIVILKPDKPSDEDTPSQKNYKQSEEKVTPIENGSLRFQKEGDDIVILKNSEEKIKKSIISSDNFNREIEITNDIYNKTLADTNPLSPHIIYHEIYYPNPENVLNVLNVFSNLTIDGLDTSNYKLFYEKLFESGFILGFIFMECFTNCVDKNVITLHDYIQTKKLNKQDYGETKKKFYYLCLNELNRLNNVGYLHCDPHLGNFLIDGETPINSLNPQIYLIDYGRTGRIEEYINNVKELHNNKKKDSDNARKEYYKIIESFEEMNKRIEQIDCKITTNCELIKNKCKQINVNFNVTGQKLNYEKQNHTNYNIYDTLISELYYLRIHYKRSNEDMFKDENSGYGWLEYLFRTMCGHVGIGVINETCDIFSGIKNYQTTKKEEIDSLITNRTVGNDIFNQIINKINDRKALVKQIGGGGRTRNSSKKQKQRKRRNTRKKPQNKTNGSKK